jgi:hypothetical protein
MQSQNYHEYPEKNNFNLQNNFQHENMNIYNGFNTNNHTPYRLGNQVNNFQSHRTPVKTNILPTTSSGYGAYYSHNDLNNNFNRNIYY